MISSKFVLALFKLPILKHRSFRLEMNYGSMMIWVGNPRSPIRVTTVNLGRNLSRNDSLILDVNLITLFKKKSRSQNDKIRE